MKMKLPFKISLLFTLAILSIFSMIGCATNSNSGQYNMILTEDVPLLESGPQQATPPSAHLSAGTRVRVLSSSGAFAYIETVRGQTGFVPMHSIQAKDQN